MHFSDKMKKEHIILWILALLFAVLMSVPFIVPHTGILALVGIVPLLCMDRIASEIGLRHVWRFHYIAFVQDDNLITISNG